MDWSFHFACERTRKSKAIKTMNFSFVIRYLHSLCDFIVCMWVCKCWWHSVRAFNTIKDEFTKWNVIWYSTGTLDEDKRQWQWEWDCIQKSEQNSTHYIIYCSDGEKWKWKLSKQNHNEQWKRNQIEWIVIKSIS